MNQPRVPHDCSLEAEGRRFEGLPCVDCAFGSSDGISGSIGPVGSGADIGLGKKAGVPTTLNDGLYTVLRPSALRLEREQRAS